jgi:polyhydroxybutyrate depolymerase
MKDYKKSSVKVMLIIVIMTVVLFKGYALEEVKISVDGVQRELQLYIPPIKNQEKLPVIYVFHGYGQELSEAIEKFKIDQYWPEAIIVYPQGLKTALQKMDKGGIMPGWQTSVGDQKDRDIRFFDEIKVYLNSKYRIDENRIYVTGFSNGAAFTYVVAAMRGSTIAAIAPIAGTLGSNKDRGIFKEIPVFHVAGKQDEIVKFNSQKDMIDFVKKLNKCSGEGIIVNKNVTEYESAINKPVSTFIYNGEHKIPKDAIPFIVEFFKRNQLKY